MADVQIVNNLITWGISNATSIAAILAWVTKPIRDRISALEDWRRATDAKLADTPTSLGERLRELDKDATADEERNAALRRDVDKLEQQLGDAQDDVAQCVSQEEFRAYCNMVGQKIEKILETLSFIRGRTGGPST